VGGRIEGIVGEVVGSEVLVVIGDIVGSIVLGKAERTNVGPMVGERV
jgi:hypothetical protein